MRCACQTYEAYRFAHEALRDAQIWAEIHNLGGLHNGPADAFRHCFWSCTMDKYLGAAAKAIADERENAGNRDGQPKDEEMMDLV
jgi:hypothetical protein